VSEAEYVQAAGSVWIPDPDPDDPRSAWNARLELLRMVGAIVRLSRPATMVETGVALGFTSATVLRSMKDLGHGHLYSIDLPALQYDPSEQVGKAVPPELRGRWTLELGDSRRLLGPLCERVAPLDLFLHDALHTYESQLREYRTAWPHLRAGGLLLSDDVSNPAFVEFAADVGADPRLVAGSSRGDVVGLLRKP
jgi:predicted O-methyltransferase YrrM